MGSPATLAAAVLVLAGLTGAAMPAATAAPMPGDNIRAVDSADYFHVAPNLAREYYEVGDPDERRRILVSEFDADGSKRYAFLVPKKKGGFEMVFGFVDGSLYLFGFKVDGKRVQSDLVELSPPALIGTTRNALGAPPVTTAVSSSAWMNVNLSGLKQRIEARLSGSVQASWHAAESVSVGADKRFEDVVSLRLSIALDVEGVVLGMPMTYDLDTGLDGTLARGFGYVEFRTSDDTFRLLPGPSVGNPARPAQPDAGRPASDQPAADPSPDGSSNQRGPEDASAPHDTQPSKP